MTANDRKQLEWLDKLIRAHRNLDDFQQASLSAWLSAGEKRSAWPGWPTLIGPRPEMEPEKKSSNSVLSWLGRKQA